MADMKAAMKTKHTVYLYSILIQYLDYFKYENGIDRVDIVLSYYPRNKFFLESGA